LERPDVRLALSVAALAMLAHGQPAPYRPIPFPPVDEARNDPQLAAFRDTLLGIAKRRVVEELVAVASATVQIDGEPFAARLRRDFTDRVTPPWDAFREALSLGGAFTTTRGAIRGRREFCAPYVYGTFPSTLPPWIGGENLPRAITRSTTPVFEAPDRSSRVLARLGHVIVEYLDHVPPEAAEPNDRGWVLIALSPTRKGYVSADAARSPRDWHVCLANEAGRWQISAAAVDEFSME
jgi:hypothetical protein